MYHMVDGLTRLMAPILPVTADELWQLLPGGAMSPSISRCSRPASRRWSTRRLSARWARLIRLREAVNVEIETAAAAEGRRHVARREGRARAPAAIARRAARAATGSDLPTLFIVSQVEVVAGRPGAPAGDRALHEDFSEGDGSGARITVRRADGVKCERCWRYVLEVSQAAATPGVCDRCLEALARPV